MYEIATALVTAAETQKESKPDKTTSDLLPEFMVLRHFTRTSDGN